MALTKGKGGWKASDEFDFDGPLKLTIETYKIGGELISRASVSKHAENMMQHIYGMRGGGDFSERLIVDATARGTEKAVSVQHEMALQKLEEITERARAHYVKFPRMKA